MKYFQFSENNSGGSWWLTSADYRALLQTGDWGLESSTLDAMDEGRFDLEFYLRHSLVGRFEDYFAAADSWQAGTGQSLDAEGCECCGPPFSLYETHLDGEFVNNAAMRAGASLLPA